MFLGTGVSTDHVATGEHHEDIGCALTAFSMAGLISMMPSRVSGATGTDNSAVRLRMEALNDFFPMAHHDWPIL